MILESSLFFSWIILFPEYFGRIRDIWAKNGCGGAGIYRNRNDEKTVKKLKNC